MFESPCISSGPKKFFSLLVCPGKKEKKKYIENTKGVNIDDEKSSFWVWLKKRYLMFIS